MNFKDFGDYEKDFKKRVAKEVKIKEDDVKIEDKWEGSAVIKMSLPKKSDEKEEKNDVQEKFESMDMARWQEVLSKPIVGVKGPGKERGKIPAKKKGSGSGSKKSSHHSVQRKLKVRRGTKTVLAEQPDGAAKKLKAATSKKEFSDLIKEHVDETFLWLHKQIEAETPMQIIIPHRTDDSECDKWNGIALGCGLSSEEEWIAPQDWFDPKDKPFDPPFLDVVRGRIMDKVAGLEALGAANKVGGKSPVLKYRIHGHKLEDLADLKTKLPYNSDEDIDERTIWLWPADSGSVLQQGDSSWYGDHVRNSPIFNKPSGYTCGIVTSPRANKLKDP